MPVPDFAPGEVLTAAAMDRVGLWRVVPTSVSGTGATLSGSDVVVASGGTDFTVNGIFSSSFRNYKLIINDFKSGAATDLEISLGTAKTGTSHLFGQVICNTAGTVFGSGGGGSAAWRVAVSRGTTVSVGAMVDILSPFDAIETTMLAQSIDSDAGGISRSTNGYHSGNTSFTSLFFSNSAGTSFTSCRVAIYGYN